MTAGLTAAALTGRIESVSVPLEAPQPGFVELSFTLRALLTIGLPVLILSAGMTNLQTFTVLRSEGYRPATSRLTVVAGLAGIVNAVFGGHVSAVGGTTAAISAAPAAGPAPERYKGVVLSSAPAVVVGLASATVMALVGSLPAALTGVVAALVIQVPFRALFLKAVKGPAMPAAVTAFAIVVTDLSFPGMPAALLAIAAGTIVALIMSQGRRLRLKLA
jgi:benzoate membrane transport protein